MIAEGSIADGPNGQVAVFTGGKWVVQGSPSMPIASGDQTALDSLGEDARQTAWLAQKANQFKQTQGAGPSALATGPGYQPLELQIPFTHTEMNLNPTRFIGERMPNVGPRLQQLESISNQAWAHMRPQGSGPMRMPEIEGFQQAFPNIDNWGQANTGITDRLNQDAGTAAQKLQFIDSFIKGGKGNYPDAVTAWTQAQQDPNRVQQTQLPPLAGTDRFGQPTAAPTYNAGTQTPPMLAYDRNTGLIQ